MLAAQPLSRAGSVGVFLACLLLCYAAAAIGALASIDARTFYAALDRPDWAPSGRVFGPVWSVLYTLMAVAAWRVWRSAGTWPPRAAAIGFLLQLTLNAAWSWTFFAWRDGGLAFTNIVLLFVAILATIVVFARHDRLAAILLAPYAAWVAFAGALNLRLWIDNPSLW